MDLLINLNRASQRAPTGRAHWTVLSLSEQNRKGAVVLDTVAGNQDQWSGHLAATAPYFIGQPQGTMKPQLRVAPAAALPDLDVEPSVNFRPSLSRTV